jgi:hypothetical protein
MEDSPFMKLFGTYPTVLHASSNVINMNALNPIVAHVMEKSKLGEASFYENDLFSSPALEEKICSDTLPPICDNSSDTESIPFMIPVEIVGKIMNECYAGDGTVHPSDHLLKLKELCELFKVAGLSRENAMKKLFPLSLKDKAREWYKLLVDPHHLEWKELESLFYSKFYPPHEVHLDRNYIYNFCPHDGESIAQAWGRLKLLMLKCPIHELPIDIIVNNFYARLSGHYKDYLDACLEGSFTRKEVKAKWDLLETIQRNTEEWDKDQGKESGINYEYDCIKSFAETADFQKLSANYGLDPQIIVDNCRAFASHINVPKEDWDMYHEPFKDTCMKNAIVVYNGNEHAQTSESVISYKHVNFCGVLRPCEKNQIKEDYCIIHRTEKTAKVYMALSKLGKKICTLYPFICEFCYDTGHFNFQCSIDNCHLSHPMSPSLYCDDKITPNQHDELTLFLGCEEILRKTSLVDMGVFDMNSVLHDCHLYCVDNCHANTYIQNIIKDDTLPKYDRTNMSFKLINRKEESSKVSSIVSNDKTEYVEKLPFPPKEEEKKKKKKKKKQRWRNKKKEETVSYPKHLTPIMAFYDNPELDDEPIPAIYRPEPIPDHDWEKHSTFDIENLYGANSENDDCYTISTIHVPPNDDKASSKLGDDVFENPFATDDYMFDTMPLAFDREYYDIGYDHNHPIGTCHSYGGITQNHSLNMQLVYNVQVLCGDHNDGYGIFNPPTIEKKINYDYDMPPLFDDYGDENNDSYLVEFAPITVTRNDYAYVGSIDYFMHVAHDKNVLCDDFIVNLIHDATGNYYERGKHKTSGISPLGDT